MIIIAALPVSLFIQNITLYFLRSHPQPAPVLIYFNERQHFHTNHVTHLILCVKWAWFVFFTNFWCYFQRIVWPLGCLCKIPPSTWPPIPAKLLICCNNSFDVNVSGWTKYMWASTSSVNKDRSVKASTKADWCLAAKLCIYSADWFKHRCEFLIHEKGATRNNPKIILCSLCGGRKTTS